jgi:hypothetical protein
MLAIRFGFAVRQKSEELSFEGSRFLDKMTSAQGGSYVLCET